MAFRELFPVYADVTFSARRKKKRLIRKTRKIVIYFAVINDYNVNSVQTCLTEFHSISLFMRNDLS